MTVSDLTEAQNVQCRMHQALSLTVSKALLLWSGLRPGDVILMNNGISKKTQNSLVKLAAKLDAKNLLFCCWCRSGQFTVCCDSPSAMRSRSGGDQAQCLRTWACADWLSIVIPTLHRTFCGSCFNVGFQTVPTISRCRFTLIGNSSSKSGIIQNLARHRRLSV